MTVEAMEVVNTEKDKETEADKKDPDTLTLEGR